MLNKKGGVGELVQAPLVIIGMVLIIVIFSILLFVFNGGKATETVIDRDSLATVENTKTVLNILDTGILVNEKMVQIKAIIATAKEHPEQTKSQIDTVMKSLPQQEDAPYLKPSEIGRPIDWYLGVDGTIIGESFNQDRGHLYGQWFVTTIQIPNLENPNQPFNILLKKYVH